MSDRKNSRYRLLWSLRKADQTAEAMVTTRAAATFEFRVRWNGKLISSQVYRNATELGSVAEAKRQELIARGWSAAAKTRSDPAAAPAAQAPAPAPAMPRRFTKDGEQWEVGPPNGESGFPPVRYRVPLTRLMDDLTLTGWISTYDVHQADLGELRRAVNQAIARVDRDD